MRVLVFTPSYPRYPGDYHGSFIQGLCSRLSRHVDLTVLAPRSRTMKPFAEPYPVERFPYLPRRSCEIVAEATMVDAPWGHLIQLPPYLLSAYLHSIRDRYDLVHTHLAIPFGLLASHSPRGTPQLITCHGSDCTQPIRNRVLLPAARHALKRADHVVAVSRHVEELAIGLGSRPAYTETIYTGVDVERFRPPPRRDGQPTVGFLGRLVPGKRVKDIMLAVKRLQIHTDVRLLVGGDGPSLPEMKLYASKLGLRDTRFLGRVSDAPRFYGLCHVYALASTNEGLSTALQEAMASGCVPVSADTPSSRELIVDGVNGLLYRPGDVVELSRSLSEALDAPQLATRARETIESRFNIDRNYAAYLDAYRETLG
jgi:glycosyltransferase involved in cell wall biosynthesis